jgi:hypothetical protein
MTNPKVLRILIVMFGLATALVHLWLFYGGFARGRPNYLFLVNSVGYLVLLGAFWWTQASTDQVRRLVHYLFMAFAAGSIVAWIVVNGGRFFLALSIFDKVIEVLLIVALWLHLRRTPQPA